MYQRSMHYYSYIADLLNLGSFVIAILFGTFNALFILYVWYTFLFVVWFKDVNDILLKPISISIFQIKKCVAEKLRMIAS